MPSAVAKPPGRKVLQISVICDLLKIANQWLPARNSSASCLSERDLETDRHEDSSLTSCNCIFSDSDTTVRQISSQTSIVDSKLDWQLTHRARPGHSVKSETPSRLAVSFSQKKNNRILCRYTQARPAGGESFGPGTRATRRIQSPSRRDRTVTVRDCGHHRDPVGPAEKLN